METSGLAIQGMLKDEGNPGSSKTYVGDKPSEGAIEASNPRVSKSRYSKKDTVAQGGTAADWTASVNVRSVMHPVWPCVLVVSP